MEVQYFPEVWRSPRGEVTGRTLRKSIAPAMRPGRCLWGLRCLWGGHGLGQRGDQRPDMALSSCAFCRMAASACWGSAASAVASSMGQRPVPVRFRMDSATSSQV